MVSPQVMARGMVALPSVAVTTHASKVWHVKMCLVVDSDVVPVRMDTREMAHGQDAEELVSSMTYFKINIIFPQIIP